MTPFRSFVLGFISILGITAQLSAQENLSELLAAPGANLSDPISRAEIVAKLRENSEKKRAAARLKATQRGLPLRITRPNGSVQEITDFENDTPVYHTTHNANAAISTGADLVRSSYSVEGAGMTIGLWDGGAARTSHREFGSRVTSPDNAPTIDHATHVGGTLAASGVLASAKGMAPLAEVDSYDWNSDISEMTSRAATAPGQADKLYLSNHSYGIITGWNYVDNGTRVWEWYGNGTSSTGFEQDFGRYNSWSRDQDTLSYNAPYYLIFRSAGNERTDNPANGELVALSPGSNMVVSFNSAVHPSGDGQYRGGFDSIGFSALAKNVVTIGSASDAVTGGLRDSTKANVSDFSSWGPTDDGRIKPDLVANGDDLTSPIGSNNSAYGRSWGTSMSTPNATGSTALLIQHYANLFSNGALRASSTKGLLIHTADDRGNAGPDYKYGWGLINAKAAADLISDHHTFPERQLITEEELNTSTTSYSQSFVWDGVSPIRATLSWTDPAGNATSTSDLRSPRLVNDLDLKLIGPAGVEHFPFVMPFVGAWTQASMNSPATTGINTTDNVEQVLLPAPPSAGTYQIVITHSGNLTNNSQKFSLILSGASSDTPPPPPLSITSISPESGLQEIVTIDISGNSLDAGASVTLSQVGSADIPALSVTLLNDDLRCQFDLISAATGLWDLTVTNPDLETATLSDAFTVIGALWSESFDGSPSGWVSDASTGSNQWILSTAASQTPDTSYFAAGPAGKSTTSLTSPVISIASNASDLQLKFWHQYDLQSRQDGGRLEFSLNGDPWFGIDSAGSGATFASNGYSTTIRNTGNPNGRSEFGGLPAWTGNSNGFIETIVNLTDTAKYAGNDLRIRWTIATNSGTASPGWYVDSISLIGDGDLANQAPQIVTAADSSSVEEVTDPDSTVFEIVRGSAIDLSVLASDDGGEGSLTYTWSVAIGDPVFFSPNGSNAAKSTTANFEAIGDYELLVSIQDIQGLTVSSTLNIRVVQAETELVLNPAAVTISYQGTQSFSAELQDQFGAPMASQPTTINWNVNDGGSIDPTGLFTSTAAGGPFIVSASSGSFNGIATITVTPAPATITLGDLSQIFDGTPRSVSVTTSPLGLATSITYDGSPTPPAAVGVYAVEATISDPNYQGNQSDQLTISGISYSSWENDKFTPAEILANEADPNADPDLDGLVNLAEYALGTDPKLMTLPPSTTSDGTFLSLVFERPLGLSDVSYEAQLSTNLVTTDWTPLTLEILSQTATTETVRARVALANNPDAQFIRLRFTSP